MNDQELITAVREQRDRVHMGVPVEEIECRSRAIRARRRIPAAGGALAVAAGAAVAVTALAPASHQPARTQLAAWTVTKTGSTVSITIRELRDPAGLQDRLRAAGVPASVTFHGQQNPACHRYAISATALPPIFQGQKGGFPVMAIHTADLPSGAGVQLATFKLKALAVELGLVHISPACTGS